MAAIAGRGLSPAFLEDLSSGMLAPIRERVRRDKTLSIELRGEYVNVYYRGGSLLRVSAADGGYSVFFDPKYFEASPPTLPDERVRSTEDVAAWLAMLPVLKDAIDLSQPGEERDAQQLLVRENNFGRTARSTDYYLCDIEYAHGKSRFDFVAVRWPSTPTDRKRQHGHRLVLGEVKFGDDALEGAAGLRAHVEAMNEFAASPDKRAALEGEMVRVFNQKRALGLIDCDKDLVGFGDEPVIVLLVLANHDPDKGTMRRVLSELPRVGDTELRVAMGSAMGYGLYERAIVSVDEAIGRWG